jgi:glucose dehydrogenase
MMLRTVSCLPRVVFLCLPLVLLVPLSAAPRRADKADDKPAVRIAGDANDWPMYNADVLGTRHNKGEKKLGAGNVATLVEKWRFPSGIWPIVGAIHATPVVVNGYVYFGTTTFATFYKLTPDGKVKWSYRNPAAKTVDKLTGKLGVPDSGFANSPLVTTDTVYVGDVGGFIYALDRANGKERWKINLRAAGFPGAHPANCTFASPILADGKIIVAGGAIEQLLAREQKYRCTGRGFVVALEPRKGKVVWKYDVGPAPAPLRPPVKIKDAWGEHVFHSGPASSSVWCTPSYDAASGLIFFGTDTFNAPRQPTKDDPKLDTKHSCAAIAVDVRTGKEKWVTQINKGDIWHQGMRGYDPATGLYKDQSIGDTPKPYTILVGRRMVRVVGFGCKNGGFYVLDLLSGAMLAHTPVYTGAPAVPPRPRPHPRTLALPGVAGGLQTGCATDGRAVYTNGMDAQLFITSADPKKSFSPPTGGRVVSISLDTSKENWRHERPKVKAVGRKGGKPAFTDVGDPVASGIALANGVAYFTTTVSNKLVALDASTGKTLKEIALGPVWCGPSVSRGRVYVGTGNLLFAPGDPREAYFPKRLTGTLYSFGLPGKDEVSQMGSGRE